MINNIPRLTATADGQMHPVPANKPDLHEIVSVTKSNEKVKSTIPNQLKNNGASVDAKQVTSEHRSHHLLQNTLCPKMAPSFAETPDLTVTYLQIWLFCIQNQSLQN